MLLKSSHLQPPHFSISLIIFLIAKVVKFDVFLLFLNSVLSPLVLKCDMVSDSFLGLIEGPTNKYIRSVTLHSCVQRNNVSGLLTYEVLVL